MKRIARERNVKGMQGERNGTGTEGEERAAA